MGEIHVNFINSNTVMVWAVVNIKHKSVSLYTEYYTNENSGKNRSFDIIIPYLINHQKSFDFCFQHPQSKLSFNKQFFYWFRLACIRFFICFSSFLHQFTQKKFVRKKIMQTNTLIWCYILDLCFEIVY